MKYLIQIILILTISSLSANEKLIGIWKPEMDKIKSTQEYKDQNAPKWVDMFSKITAEFTKEGDLIQYKSGKVMMKLKYKVVAEKGDTLHVVITAPGQAGQENYIITLNGKNEITQVLADKDFNKNKTDLPIIFVRTTK